MTEDQQKFTTVDAYIEGATYDVEPRLVETRRVVRAALPDAEETISHDIPTYKQHGVIVVQFAGHPEHTSLNLFPTAGTFAHFAEELSSYRTSKSAIRFPLDEPLPIELIDAIVRFRSNEAGEYAARRSAGR